MKKYIIITLLALFSVSVFSQKIEMSKNEWYDWYDGISTADTAGGTTAATFKIFVNKNFLYYYEIIAELDSSGDGTDFTVELEGSMNNIDYYDISSDTWNVTTSDTTYRFNNLSHTETIASYAITGTTIWDTASASGDTATYVETVAAQTATVNEAKVGWRWLQVKVTGGGSGARMILDRIDVAILEE